MNMTDTDLSSELLIAQLLEEDLQNLHYAQQAEKLQLESVLSVSAFRNGKMPRFTKSKATSDFLLLNDADIAMEIFLSEARTGGDKAFAESLQVAQDASIIAGKQYAQKLAAEEKKLALDAEFARKLQSAGDNEDLDLDSVKDAESFLGRDVVDKILAADLNDKGKAKALVTGKGKFKSEDVGYYIKTEPDEDMEDVKPTFTENLPLCGICYEPFKQTYSPITASQTANSSNRLQFGLRLPCPSQHSYCQGCLTSYIRGKLDPADDGGGNPEVVVFPIRCPECPPTQWEDGIPDDVAQRVLSEKGMVLWHHQRLLDSIERHYCPNPKCSMRVQVHDDPDEPMATCPSCSEVMCVPCRVIWHDGVTCEEFQALPEDEKSPEDRLVFLLAKAKKWRRCPKCAALVELTHGCNHITCLCGTHFCFKCGSLWDKAESKCTRLPSCDMWDDEMLLEERERNRAAVQMHVPRQPALAPPPYNQIELVPPVLAPAPPQIPIFRPNRMNASLQWMLDSNIVCSRHLFTTDMIRSLVCGYCNARANSMPDLMYHLSHVNHHDVFACCGRFFKRETDFDRHRQAEVQRFSGDHMYTVERSSRNTGGWW